MSTVLVIGTSDCNQERWERQNQKHLWRKWEGKAEPGREAPKEELARDDNINMDHGET